MGWNARLYSGEILRERDNIKWDDLNIHLIESLWLDGMEKFKFFKSCIKNFLEFIQFKTARMDSDRNVNIESRSIGWSDGEKEYVLRINEKTGRCTSETTKRVHFHPLSIFDNQDCNLKKR